MMRLVIFVISVVISVSVVSSCGQDGDALKEALSEAESCIEDAPRHSLEILKQIDTASLSSRKIRAKYSLLYSMALDKNYIDVITDSIISPAVKFYKHHGTPQERMLTNYYLGRIRMNASNYEEALQQIDDKGYALPWQSDGRTVIKVGANFSSQLRRLDGWIVA